MEASENQAPLLSDELLRDLVELAAQPLRKRYEKEANSHRNMLQRAAKGDFEIDPAWREFRSFLRDMGLAPGPEWTIDRIDPEVRRYGPGLVRWSDKRQQTENRRNTRWIWLEGERTTIATLAAKVGQPYNTVYSAIQRGVRPEQIVASSAPAPGRYCPPRYESRPADLDGWYARYDAWRRSVRKDRRRFATPEVFDICQTSAGYRTAEQLLAKQGLFELSPDEEAESDALLATPTGEIYRKAFDWIDFAVEALKAQDAELASKFERRMGWTYPDFHRFGAWLTAADDDRYGW